MQPTSNHFCKTRTKTPHHDWVINSSFPDQAKADCIAYEALWNRCEQSRMLRWSYTPYRGHEWDELKRTYQKLPQLLGGRGSSNWMLIHWITVTSRTVQYSSIPCFFLQRRSICLIYPRHSSSSSMLWSWPNRLFVQDQLIPTLVSLKSTTIWWRWWRVVSRSFI